MLCGKQFFQEISEKILSSDFSRKWGNIMAYTVYLDAGHGGYDNGASDGNRKEKNDTLRLALAVGEILQNNGVAVGYTQGWKMSMIRLCARHKLQMRQERICLFLSTAMRRSTAINIMGYRH